MNLTDACGLSLNGQPVNRLTKDGTTLWYAEPLAPLCLIALQDNSTVKLGKTGNAPTLNLEYSYDGSTWNAYPSATLAQATVLTLAHTGDRVYFRASTPNLRLASAARVYNSFGLTGKIRVAGSLLSLLDKATRVTRPPSYCFCRLFTGCTALYEIDPSALPRYAELDYAGVYAYLFYGCTNLRSPIKFRSTVLHGSTVAMQAFNGCASIPTISLPSTTAFSNATFTNTHLSAIYAKNLTSPNYLPANLPRLFVDNGFLVSNADNTAVYDTDSDNTSLRWVSDLLTHDHTLDLSSVTTIGQNALVSTTLTAVTCPDLSAIRNQSITTLRLLSGDNLQNIGTLPADILSVCVDPNVIRTCTFSLDTCTSLQGGWWQQPRRYPQMTRNPGYLYSNVILPDDWDDLVLTARFPALTAIADGSFNQYSRPAAQRRPHTLDLGPVVTSIGDVAFQAVPIKTLVVPEQVTALGGWSFGDTALSSVVFAGNRIRTLADVFGMTSLKEVILSAYPDALSSFVSITKAKGSYGTFGAGTALSIYVPDAVYPALSAQSTQWASYKDNLYPMTAKTHDYLNFTAVGGPLNLRLLKVVDESDYADIAPDELNLSVSFDKRTWTRYDFSEITLAAGKTMWIKGNNATLGTFSGGSGGFTEFTYHWAFWGAGDCSADGEVVSELSETCVVDEIPDACFLGHFIDLLEEYGDKTKLIHAPNITARRLNWYSCCYMFAEQYSLTTIPKIDIRECGADAFCDIFYNCTGLRDLSDKTLGPWTVEAVGMEYMFDFCRYLEKAPVLSGLTGTGYAPFGYMFAACGHLDWLKTDWTEWTSHTSSGRTDPDTYYWLNGARNDANCIFECPAALDTSIRDISHIPSNWTVRPC